ncbi:cellulase family glycosylhydrolase [Flavobacterium sp. SUN052]|uniref:cellulase family glycosylhydrolase n=1 Tax=Flavobacterium sp. SUN052 TaxID=3002441 RepID=UPI00237D69B1|nr:cellulase family glycosylhydrolase [Flavobacterium sp. SUN052]MEC4003762.1 cellulase family glycosylhydrolase [Flavobacterium sp. SUN052]
MNKVFYFGVILVFYGFVSCSKDSNNRENSDIEQYNIQGSKIYNYKNPIQLIGANALHVFGGTSNDMNSWNLDIVREFIGNCNEVPLSGSAIQSNSGTWLYSMQSLVDANRANNKITIFCSFGWDGTSATEFTGKNPTQTFWYNDYKMKLQQWATHFKDQKDVWIEVWNEPYTYDGSDNATDVTWETDMNELVSVVRTTGNKNIILVPCAKQGQDESVLINKGTAFLQNKSNVLFDIHAYERWLLVSNAEIDSRLQNLKSKNLPVFFGEVAPVNAGVLMNPSYFLSALHSNGISVTAWLWKYEATDKDALLTSDGMPNNTSNNNWGSLYKNLATSSRNP